MTGAPEPAPANGALPIAVVILAAGASRRLGRPKQLVPHPAGGSLLTHTITTASAADAHAIIVVLGAQAALIRSQLPASFPANVRFVEHTGWARGVGTTIACGLAAALAAEPATAAVLLLLCDQPALDGALIKTFITAARATPEALFVSDYSVGRGPPVLFPRDCFPALLALRGDTGAREILRHQAGRVRCIPFPGGARDIDTPTDLESPRP